MADAGEQQHAGISDRVIEEVSYPAGYAAGLAPVQLAWVAALNGFQAPDPGGPYEYCEIGCGSARTVLVLAAANPEAGFTGIDLSDQHIQVGQRIAEAGELENLRLLAADVATLDDGAVPDFDFITMHGVFAWVSEEVRAAILGFIDRKLRPGGIVHVSYNSLPGWSAVAPIRSYFLQRAPHLDGEPTDKVKIILDELEELREAKAPFFTANESAGVVLGAVRAQDPRYVVHEFFSPHWQPLAFTDVASRMRELGLQYVGDSRTVENLPEHNVPPSFVSRIRSVEDRWERETLRDFVTNRFFRGDVYQRGEPVAEGARDELVGAVRLGMERTPAEVGQEIHVSGAALRVEGTAVEVVQQLVFHDNRPIRELLAHPALAGVARDELLEALTVLTVDRSLVPCARPAVDFDEVRSAIRPAPALNRALLSEPAQQWVVLASPVTGAGVAVHAIEACLLCGLGSPDPVATALAEIDRRGINLVRGDEGLDAAGREKEVMKLLEAFATHKLAMLYALGMVEQTSP